ncbi:MAG: hypothetical protein JXA28_11460 [Bacteroidetes bacterium]|nr:hypothetical protein [Bacteroidota bacterium]
MRFVIRILLFAGFCASVAQGQVFWENDFGPWGGPVNDLADGSAGALYAAGSTGLFRSDDDGQSWQLSALGGVDVRTVHQSGAGTLFAGIGGMLLRSTDGGETWQDTLFADVAPLFEHSSGALFCGSGGKAYVSTDDGRSWTTLALLRGPDFQTDLWTELDASRSGREGNPRPRRTS